MKFHPGKVIKKSTGRVKLVSKFHKLFPRLNKMADKAKNRNLLLNHCSKFNVITDRNPVSKLDKHEWCQCSYPVTLGAQWLSGRVLDSRPRGPRFEPHQHHFVVSLSRNINPSLVLVQHRKIRPCITERLLVGRKESNQTVRINYQKKISYSI